MKHFTDRIFYLDRTGCLAHISYLTSGSWVLHFLDDGGVWYVEIIADSYDMLFNMIRRDDPILILHEEWHGTADYTRREGVQ